jgi:hypothetical protein
MNAVSRDVLLMKVIRNISQYTYNKSRNIETTNQSVRSCGREGYDDSRNRFEQVEGKKNDSDHFRQHNDFTSLWTHHVLDLFKLCQQASAENEDLLVEVLGTIANLTVADLPRGMVFADLIVRYGMVELLQRHLAPGMYQDDVVLASVQVAGAFCSEHEAARVLIESPLVRNINDILSSKSSDNEIVLQSLWCVFQLLAYDDTYESLLYNTSLVDNICDCLGNRNNEVRMMADEILSIITDLDRIEVEIDEEYPSNDLSEESDASDDRKKNGQREGNYFGKKTTVRRLGELGEKVRFARYSIHNKEWLLWANARNIHSLEEDQSDRPDIPRSESSQYEENGLDDDSGQWNVGSLGRHEMVQMVGVSDEDEDFATSAYNSNHKFKNSSVF